MTIQKLEGRGLLILRERPLLAFAAAFVFLIYVFNAWTPSHYGYAAHVLGLRNAGPVFGTAREIRSDDWALTTPYFQIAVANDLGPTNKFSPFKENLKSYLALPSRDWSMVFKPDLAAFLVLDPAHAFSLHFAILAAGFLLGFALLLRQLGCSSGTAIAGSALLFLSQFVQVWWSSNAPVFAWAPWPAVIFLWRGPWLVRFPALTYVMAVWLIDLLYPPFVAGAGLAFAILIAACRPEALRLSNAIPAAIAAAVGCAIAWLHFDDLIPVMAHTVYPGQRHNTGGGVPLLQMFAHVFPNFVTGEYEPLGSWSTNACEIGVIGSWLPLALLTFGDWKAIRQWIKENGRSVFVWAVGLELLGAWTLLPIPGWLAPGLNLSPGYRMLWGFGLTLFLGLCVLFDKAPLIFNSRRVAIFVGAVVAAWAISKFVVFHPSDRHALFDLAVIGVLISLLPIRHLAPRFLPVRRLLLLMLVLTSALTFGRFNPIQSARPIFAKQSSPLLDTMGAYARANPKGFAVALGWYGATLNGVGVPAVNHALLRPETDFFRRAYPDLEPGTFNEVFNRYEHLTPSLRWAPSVATIDGVFITAEPFAIRLPLRVVGDLRDPASALDDINAVRLGPQEWGVVAQGHTQWSEFLPTQKIEISLPAQIGRLSSAQAYRLPRPDLPAGFAAGFGLRVRVQTTKPLASFPVSALLVRPVS